MEPEGNQEKVGYADRIKVRIWSIRHRYNVLKEKTQRDIAWLLPRWLVYWCGIRINAHATSGKYGMTNVDGLTVMKALARWKTSNKLVVEEDGYTMLDEYDLSIHFPNEGEADPEFFPGGNLR
jgi:hypothetical protein